MTEDFSGFVAWVEERFGTAAGYIAAILVIVLVLSAVPIAYGYYLG
jgi:hypothetical protein